MTDHQLRVETIKLAKLEPEPKGSIRTIQSEMERRYISELTTDEPDQRRLAELKSSIDGIDRSYIQDYSEYGTGKWRAKHPFPPD